MLDAYIIERIRQEREPKESGLQPLHIEVPAPREEDEPRWREPAPPDPAEKERGVVIIDFNI